jgi:hypothetical protein
MKVYNSSLSLKKLRFHSIIFGSTFYKGGKREKSVINNLAPPFLKVDKVDLAPPFLNVELNMHWFLTTYLIHFRVPLLLQLLHG